jgi:hypothetical protein
MVLKELLKLLNKIKKCHPEAADAVVWNDKHPIQYVGYDQKHKPARIKLEE